MKHLRLFEDNNTLKPGTIFEIPKGFRVFDNNFPAGEYIINKNLYGRWLAQNTKQRIMVSFNDGEWEKFILKGWFIPKIKEKEIKGIKPTYKTVAEMEQALRDINFFVGGLTDDQIKHYYNKYIINK